MHHEGTKTGSFKRMYQDETGDVLERRRQYQCVGTLLPHLGKQLPLAALARLAARRVQLCLQLYEELPKSKLLLEAIFLLGSIQSAYGMLAISAGIPTRISNATGFPARSAGLNFHRLRASRAASSI